MGHFDEFQWQTPESNPKKAKMHHWVGLWLLVLWRFMARKSLVKKSLVSLDFGLSASKPEKKDETKHSLSVSSRKRHGPPWPPWSSATASLFDFTSWSAVCNLFWKLCHKGISILVGSVHHQISSRRVPYHQKINLAVARSQTENAAEREPSATVRPLTGGACYR